MPWYWIDPLKDPRWKGISERHPAASVFHSTGWLRALQRTYGYTPTAVTSCPPGSELTNAILFCRVNSFLTGRRLVSLPFSDHCQPLGSPEEVNCLAEGARELLEREKLKYIELRPMDSTRVHGMEPGEAFYFHVLDLRPSLDEIYRGLHGDCVRRKIKRAEKEQLTVEEGRSKNLLREFYEMQVRTRQKHALPPQPINWFANVVEELGGRSSIRVARFQGRAVAAILTLRHGKTEVYKYGCSVAEDNNRGGTQLLFWKAIQDAKNAGMESMDLGRSDIANEGLAVFKERLGGVRRTITYCRFPAQQGLSRESKFLARLPRPLLKLAGRLLYRHMG